MSEDTANLSAALVRAGRLNFSVTAVEACPCYCLKDAFEVADRCVTVKSGKPLCLTLAADMTNAVLQAEKAPDAMREEPLLFKCGGCGGSVSMIGAPVSDLYASLSDEQRRRVEALVETLGRFSLFKTLNAGELRTIVPEIKAGNFEKGAIIIRQGEFGRSLYIVESGSVDVLAGKNDEVLIATLGAGEIFGEMSLLSGACCSATIRVRENSRILALDGGLFTNMVIRYPSLQDYLFHLLTRRLRETNALKETQLGRGLKGSLDDLQLPELLQALHMSRKSGRLCLNTPRGEGTVMMKHGDMVDADYLQLRDADAFFELLRDDDGSFSFSPSLPPEISDRAPLGDFMELLMEGFVRLDEARRAATNNK